jgi:dolichyl-phosphate-mannose-protein mannosyltransferase
VTRRGLLVLALAVGVALRVYPLHARYFHPDQEYQPAWALAAFARGDWRPATYIYPTGFLYLLRSSYTLAYAACRALGVVHDRIDVLGAFVLDPFPFLRVARLWSCVASVATIWATGRLAQRVFDAPAAALATAAIAVNFLAVREAHYGSLDGCATAFFVATLVVALAVVERPRRSTLLLAGVLAGLTAGFRYQLALGALCVPAAALASPDAGRRRLGDVAVAGAAALATFALLSPHTLLEAPAVFAEMQEQLTRSYRGFNLHALPLPQSLALASGRMICVLALVGAAVAASRRPRQALTVAAGVVPYVAALSPAGLRFVRYLLPVSPVVATLAAGGVRALARPLPRGARAVAAAAVLAAALVDPFTRAVALDRLLATEDTRDRAAAWLAAHTGAGDPVCFRCGTVYAHPSQPLAPGPRAILFGRDAAATIAARLSPPPPPDFACGPTFTGWVVVAEHPVLAFASTPPETAALLQARGRRVVRFEAVPADVPPDAVVFEPIDANFSPLDGFAHVRAPGPNLEIWWLPPP